MWHIMKSANLDKASLKEDYKNVVKQKLDIVNSRISVKIGGITFSSLLQGFSLFQDFLFSEMAKNLEILFL